MNDEIANIERQFALLERIPVGICVLRDDFVVLFWNRCLEDWTKIASQDIVGTHLGDRFPHFKQSRYITRLQQVFEGGPPTIFSSQLHKHLIPSPLPNGSLRVQYTTVTSLPSVTGEGFYALLVVQDVTDLTHRIHDYRVMRDRALKEIEERKQAQEELYRKTRELEQRNLELTQLGQMSEFLQACLHVREAYKAIGTSMGVLFPGTSGALYIFDRDRNRLEAVTTWGDKLASPPTFEPDQCWALLRERAHFVADLTSPWMCEHIYTQVAEYCCIPLMAQGKSLGVLYLSAPDSGYLSEAKQLLAVTVTEQISLALANIELRETLHDQSIRDPLTSLFNRRYLSEFLEREVQRVKRQQTTLGVVMLDVDRFKVLNDTCGHEAGDRVLRALSVYLQDNIRGSDVACRYGGEEFLLVLPDANLEVTTHRAEQLRAGIKQLRIEYEGQVLDNVTVSVGVACFPNHGETPDEVIQAADAALYRAKQQGRDRTIAYANAL
jgi:diguanylate cyclase (GGDEF)-like protein